MIYIENNSTDPRYNLAFEEYVFNSVLPDQTVLLLWRNSPSVIIGRFQNTYNEINMQFIEEKGINVVRRMTGGGAVYHDLGNLNYSFISQEHDKRIDFKRFMLPVKTALEKMGIAAELSGRNDLLVDGKKISGNAQLNRNGRVLHHGTLLFDVNLEDMVQALNVDIAKMVSKGVQSIRSRVTNIREQLHEKIDIQSFQTELLKSLFNNTKPEIYELSEKDRLAIRKIAEDKYSSWDWNFGKSPAFGVQKKGRFDFGSVEFNFDVQNGIIQQCRIFGDFFCNNDISLLEAKFCGRRYNKIEIMQLKEDVQSYFELSENEIEKLLLL